MKEPTETGRRLAAVWFADIVGYTTLSATDEDGALEVVGVFQRIAEEVVEQHSGRVVKYIGDAALAEFASADGAIRSALVLMERFAEHEAANRYGSTLRIGVNIGEVISSPDGDIYGDGVNLASRLQNQADPGQVIASEAVHAQIRQRPVFRTESLGNRAVKGIADPVTLYAVTLQEAGGAPRATSSRETKKGADGQKSTRAWLVAPAVVGLAAMLVFVVLDPSGVVDRTLRGAGVSVSATTYDVIEGGMEIGGSVTVAFTEAIDQATATSQNVQLLDSEGQPVPAEVSVGADAFTVVLDPRATLAFGSTYTLVLGEALRDQDGRALKDPEDSAGGVRFTILTQPAPTDEPPATARLADGVDAERVPAQGPIPVQFSEPVDPQTASAGGVRLADENGGPVEASFLFTADNREVRLEPVNALRRGGRYVVLVDSTVTTATGLAVSPDTLTFRVEPTPSTRAATPTPPSAGGATPAASRTGPATLNLTATPQAARPFLKVVVDGDTLGAPPVTGLRLAEGRSHAITIVGVPDLSAYTLAVYSSEVLAEPGRVLNITAEITAFGSIDVVSDPVGTLFVDGHQLGRTPIVGYPVTAGVIHRLEIRPLPADEARVGPVTAEFRVESLEWKSLGRLTLPPIG